MMCACNSRPIQSEGRRGAVEDSIRLDSFRVDFGAIRSVTIPLRCGPNRFAPDSIRFRFHLIRFRSEPDPNPICTASNMIPIRFRFESIRLVEGCRSEGRSRRLKVRRAKVAVEGPKAETQFRFDSIPIPSEGPKVKGCGRQFGSIRFDSVSIRYVSIPVRCGWNRFDSDLIRSRFHPVRFRIRIDLVPIRFDSDSIQIRLDSGSNRFDSFRFNADSM